MNIVLKFFVRIFIGSKGLAWDLLLKMHMILVVPGLFFGNPHPQSIGESFTTLIHPEDCFVHSVFSHPNEAFGALHV